MRRYLDDPMVSAEAIDAEDWPWSGDNCLITIDGRLRATDRSENVYIADGFNVYPAEVEQMLSSHPEVAEVAVVPVPDERIWARFCCAACRPNFGSGFDPDLVS